MSFQYRSPTFVTIREEKEAAERAAFAAVLARSEEVIADRRAYEARQLAAVEAAKAESDRKTCWWRLTPTDAWPTDYVDHLRSTNEHVTAHDADYDPFETQTGLHSFPTAFPERW